MVSWDNTPLLASLRWEWELGCILMLDLDVDNDVGFG